MPVRVGVNGFGRIGRAFVRCALERDMEVIAINDVAPVGTLAHLLDYDSTYGRLHLPVRHDNDTIYVDRAPIVVTAVPEPAELPWGELGVDVVIESTGRFVSRPEAARHLKAGARKVLVSAPGRDADVTVVMGVNQADYDPDRHDVISNASCATNCVAPMVKVLHEAFGIVKGTLTTVHGYTNDQVLLDAPHEDPRRARSAAVNIVPTSTGAARTTGEILPDLAGRLIGTAVRVPVETGSLTDLTALLLRPVSVGEVNAVFLRAAREELLGILRVTSEPVVSRDIVGDPVSCVLDVSLTQTDGELVEVFGWYDNEWGYSNRLADLAEYVGRRL
jgi:glyceraldehyde 3-phosphate dehydrogenase